MYRVIPCGRVTSSVWMGLLWRWSEAPHLVWHETPGMLRTSLKRGCGHGRSNANLPWRLVVCEPGAAAVTQGRRSRPHSPRQPTSPSSPCDSQHAEPESPTRAAAARKAALRRASKSALRGVVRTTVNHRSELGPFGFTRARGGNARRCKGFVGKVILTRGRGGNARRVKGDGTWAPSGITRGRGGNARRVKGAG